MQRYFLEPDGAAYLGIESGFVERVARLIDAFRAAKIPVIFTRHAHQKGKPTGEMGRWWGAELPWDGDDDAELSPRIRPAKGEAVLVKIHYSAFIDTGLEKILRNDGIEKLFVCGVMTNVCVESTARHAFMLDFDVTVIEDACATKSKDYHRASMLNLGYAFANIERTADILTAIST